MEKLILEIYEFGKSNSDQIVTIPLAQLEVAQRVMPSKLRAVLDREEINI